MKICSWNVNSIRQRTHPDHDRLTPWLQEHRPDVVCLQELQCTHGQFPHQTIAAAGYRALLSTQKGKNGVALLTRLDKPAPEPVAAPWPPVPSTAPQEARFVAGNCDGTVVACVYVPYGRGPEDPQWVHKLRFFTDLKQWARGIIRSGQCLAIVGDFNVAPEPCDASSTDALLAAALPPAEDLWAPWCHPHMRKALKGLVAIGLEDVGATLPDAQRPFTMWDTRNFGPDTSLGVRVDLILASTPLAARLLSTEVHSAMRSGFKPSDHVPVAADFRNIERIYGAVSGSRLYGLETSNSDADVRGVFLPSRHDLLLGRVPRLELVQRRKVVGEKNTSEDVDITFCNPTEFVNDLMQGLPSAWELLFAPPQALTRDVTPLGRQFMGKLRQSSHRLWPKNMASIVAFSDRTRKSYLRQFTGAAGKTMTSTAFAPEVQVGPNGKPLSHALRVLQQAQQMHSGQTMTFPRPNAAKLLAIKEGTAPLQSVLDDIAAARAAVMAVSIANEPLVPADDSFGFACVKELHDEHLMMSRWALQPPVFRSLPSPEPRAPGPLEALDLARRSL